MSFKENKYEIVRNIISYEQANFLFNYLMLKHDAIVHMTNRKWLPPRIADSQLVMEGPTGSQYPLTGYHSSSKDQVPGAYNIYGDHAMETLLMQLLPTISRITNLTLVPGYSFARLYKKGNKLVRHKDRVSCEISTTIHLGGELWPIYLDPTGKSGVKKFYSINKVQLKKKRSKGMAITLDPGDMLIYRGADLEHWRNPLKGNLCGQTFLHYSDKNGPFGETNKLDRRPVLGFPFVHQKEVTSAEWEIKGFKK